MSDFPPGDLPPPPGSYPAPPPPPSSYPPPPYPSQDQPGYQQQGYGWTQGGPADLAGFWIRFAASLLDGLIVGVPVAIVGLAIDSDSFFVNFGAGYNPTGSFIVNILSTIVGVLYYSLLEGGPTGQTLGKQVCSIRVVDADTLQPGIGAGRGCGRYFAHILSGLPLGLGYFWMLWDPKKQTWHDKLVRTLVVKA